MRRLLAALLCIALALPAGIPVEAQFPFPVGHYSSGEVTPPNPGCCGTEFNGSTQYLSHSSSTGFTDDDEFTLSIWFKRDTTGAETLFRLYQGGTTRQAIVLDSSDRAVVFNRNDGTTTLAHYVSTETVTDTTWHHLLASVDLSAGARHVYLDDTEITYGTDTTVNGAIDWTTDEYLVAATTGGTANYDGVLSEVWFDVGTYIDLSVTANRRDFIDASGDPVDLGSDGSTPTGSAPDIYMSDAAGTNTGTTANFAATGSPTSADGPNP